ncbi:MAG: tripartite tricarboxylate transporter substrate binding protein [Betaproteobacteria bacterium]|nr:tripartite tricarboxylate transporter substrate binding protein [Betaproteobacteria bacterium]
MLRRALLLFAVPISALLAPVYALAQAWPAQSVKMIVGFPPGGTTDVIARLVSQELTERLGKSFVIENRPGASGTIATGALARSPADGYTLLMVSSTHGTAPSLYASLPYEEKDLAPVGLIASTPYALVVHPTLPATNMATLIAYLKHNPGKVEYASSSPGTAQHLAGEMLKRSAGVNIIHVPYKGTGALMPDVLAGRVPMLFENVAVITPHIKKGSLLPIAVTSAKRTPLLPEVPTLRESSVGLDEFEVLGWFVVYAPAKTPPEVVRLLNVEMNRLIAKPAIVQRLQELGAEPLGGAPEQVGAFVKGEQDKWGRVIRDAGITPQ